MTIDNQIWLGDYGILQHDEMGLTSDNGDTWTTEITNADLEDLLNDSCAYRGESANRESLLEEILCHVSIKTEELCAFCKKPGKTNDVTNTIVCDACFFPLMEAVESVKANQ